MLTLTWFLLVLGLELISFQFLFFAVLLILLLKPPLLASLGFWLSVAGVFYIFLLIRWFRDYPAWFITVVAIPVGVFLLMFPIGHIVFQNTTPWQLMSPPLSLAFILFYPVALFVHLLGMGDLFDPALLALFDLPKSAVAIEMPTPLTLLYIALSIASIWSKKIFYATLLLAALITAYYMILVSFASG